MAYIGTILVNVVLVHGSVRSYEQSCGGKEISSVIKNDDFDAYVMHELDVGHFE